MIGSNWYFAKCAEGYPGVCGIMVDVGESEMRLGLNLTNTVRALIWRRDPYGKTVKGTAELDNDTRASLTAYGFKLEEVDGGRWQSTVPVSIRHFYRQVVGTLTHGLAE